MVRHRNPAVGCAYDRPANPGRLVDHSSCSLQSSSSVTPLATPAIPYPEIKRISLADAKAAFDLKSAIFIDVRGEPYYSEAHVPGAISMTYDELSSRMGELDKKAWIITYCT